ncbi:MAG: DUF881 domain-containing protein [Nocardioides sp.]
MLCGALFPISGFNSNGGDLRPGRYSDLGDLAEAQRREADRLTERAAGLNQEITTLTAEIKDARVQAARRRVGRLEAPAGLTEVAGAGLTITLSDAPDSLRETSEEDPSLLVVHQQDIQAVVNALWRGGADAITIQGQRVITTTGIRCEGGMVQLHGLPYSQPYVIGAIGDPDALMGAIDADPLVNTYRAQTEDPEIGIGWDAVTSEAMTAPAYAGVLAGRYARPARPNES